MALAEFSGRTATVSQDGNWYFLLHLQGLQTTYSPSRSKAPEKRLRLGHTVETSNLPHTFLSPSVLNPKSLQTAFVDLSCAQMGVRNDRELQCQPWSSASQLLTSHYQRRNRDDFVWASNRMCVLARGSDFTDDWKTAVGGGISVTAARWGKWVKVCWIRKLCFWLMTV